MRAYGSIFRIRIINGLQYRSVALGAVLMRFFWGLMEILAYAALFRMGDGGFSMTFEQTVSYVWMQQVLFVLFRVVVGDSEIYAAIEEGSIAYELVRPANLYGRWFTQSAANRIAPTLLGSMPLLLIVPFMPGKYRLIFPSSIRQILLFLLSCVLALGVVAAFAMLMYISLFYLTSQRGIKIIVTAVTHFFSGGMIPLNFFPDRARGIVQILPFAAMRDMPLQIWCGTMTGTEVYRGMLLQVFWLLMLVMAGYAAMERALKRVVVQGG